MPCRRKPAYDTKKAAKRHGSITYGKGNFSVKETKRGWKAYER